MQSDFCPVCERHKLTRMKGEYEPDGQQISPDECGCSACGFRYQQHVNRSEVEAASQYRRRIIDHWVTLRKIFMK